MADAAAQQGALRFGIFEVDLDAGEVRKSGRKVRLQEQPFRLLAALVEKNGDVVTREELKEKLWPADTYVDFDRSLNTATSKLRDALGDSAASPRFIETLPRRGYRFLASVEGLAPPPAEPGAPEAAAKTEAELRRQVRRARISAALALVGALAALAAVWRSQAPDTPPPLRKFSLSLPGFTQGGPTFASTTISPNGQYIAYASADQRKLAVWDLDSDQHRVLEGTERALEPFWSPNSSAIGFWTETGEIKRVSPQGGPVTLVARAVGCCAFGAWSPSGESIVYAHDQRLKEVPATGGEPVEIRSPEMLRAGDGAISKLRPVFLPLPNRRVVVFSRSLPSGSRLDLLDLETGRQRSLLETQAALADPVYSPSGHLVYQGPGRALWAAPFSLETLRIVGEPFPIAENAARPSIASDQTLVFSDYSGAKHRLVWVNRQGERLSAVTEPRGRNGYFALSPDGRFVASQSSSGAWVHDIRRKTKAPLARREVASGVPAWSWSGGRRLFSNRNGIFVGSTDGSGEVALVHAAVPGRLTFVSSWSRDEKYIFFDHNSKDVHYLEKNAKGEYEERRFLTSEFTEKAAVPSPDNRLVAYVSDESGRLDVYVRGFPDGGSWRKVSQDGGRAVRWSRDGRKLYYSAGSTLYEVDVRFDPELELSPPRKVFDWPGLGDAANVSAYHRYDVSPDGERFLVVESLPEGQTKLRLIQNWYEEFRDQQGN